MSVSMSITGHAELDRLLHRITSDTLNDPAAMRAQMRKSTRSAARQIVLPAAIQRVPVDEGFLESELKVRAIKRTKGRLGHMVGFNDDLFMGDTFYGGILEYGWKHHKSGRQIPADSFLRSALWENEQRILTHVRMSFIQYVRKLNSTISPASPRLARLGKFESAEFDFGTLTASVPAFGS